MKDESNGGPDPATKDAQSASTDMVTDSMGNEVTLPVKPIIDVVRKAASDPVVGLHYRAQLTFGFHSWKEDSQRAEYDRALAERFKIGRYNLYEAVQCMVESEGFSGSANSMLEKLEDSIKENALIVHAHGHNEIWVYKTGKVIRPWYLECRWDVLNKWLDENEPYISFRFFDPAKQTSTHVSPKGITNDQVRTAFVGMHFNDAQWKKYLANPLAWMKDAQLVRGTRSIKHLAVWDPVILATALMEGNRKVPLSKLDSAFTKHRFLKDWQEEWARATEDLR